MSFLTLNGLTIPIARGGQVQPVVIGGQDRAFDGSLISDERAVKRQWKFITTAMRPSDADVVRGLLQAKNDVFSWEGASLYSEKGLPVYGTPAGYTFRSRYAVDGAEVVDECKTSLGSYAIAVEKAKTNLLSSNSRTAENAPTGYTSDGATLSGDTANYWQGTKSLKAECASDGDGFLVDAVDPGASSAGITYAASVYVKGTVNGQSVSLVLTDVTNGASGAAVPVTLTTAGKWYRASCTITIGGSACRNLYLAVYANTSGGTFYADGFQIEQSQSPTSWVNGSRVDGSLVYPRDSLAGKCGLTVSAWAVMTSANSTTDRVLFEITDSLSRILRLSRTASTNDLKWSVQGVAGTVTATTPWNGSWHHIIATLNPYPAAGGHVLQLWVDGVSIGTADPVLGGFDTSSGTTFRVGCSATSGLGFAAGIIDHMVCMPFAATTDLVAALYAMTSSTVATAPTLLACGDAVDSVPTNVRGSISSEVYAQLQDGATWRNNMRRLGIELQEV